MNTDFSSVMAAETKRSNGMVVSSNDGSASEDKIERMKDAVEEVKQVSLSVDLVLEIHEIHDSRYQIYGPRFCPAKCQFWPCVPLTI